MALKRETEKTAYGDNTLSVLFVRHGSTTEAPRKQTGVVEMCVGVGVHRVRIVIGKCQEVPGSAVREGEQQNTFHLIPPPISTFPHKQWKTERERESFHSFRMLSVSSNKGKMNEERHGNSMNWLPLLRMQIAYGKNWNAIWKTIYIRGGKKKGKFFVFFFFLSHYQNHNDYKS